MSYTSKLLTNCMLVLLIVLSSITFSSCSKESDDETVPEVEPGLSLGIVSIPNLRDMGGYKTTNGATISRGLVYRSNQLSSISENDMLLLAKLNLKTDFDLRTSTERDAKPDELPSGVNNVWLDVLADDPNSGPANLIELLQDPLQANIDLGNGQVEEKFKVAYRQFISLNSAQIAFKELFLSLGDETQLPALFHCTTGKDRTGWSAAALLTIIGVPYEEVLEDYLLSNDYILPMYADLIEGFVEAGGERNIVESILGVKEEYLVAAFEEMNTEYGSIENYFSVGLGISIDQQNALRNLYLNNK